MEERGPPRRLGEYHVANVQACLVGDDSAGVRGLDWRIVSGAGLFSKGPEAPALALAKGSFEGRLFRLSGLARGLALRPAVRGGGVDVDSR